MTQSKTGIEMIDPLFQKMMQSAYLLEDKQKYLSRCISSTWRTWEWAIDKIFDNLSIINDPEELTERILASYVTIYSRDQVIEAAIATAKNLYNVDLSGSA